MNKKKHININTLSSSNRGRLPLFGELTAKPKPTKKWLFFPASFIFHAGVIAVLVIAPLLEADRELPPVKTINIVITTPHQLSMPVGRSGSSRRTAGKKNDAVKKKPQKPAGPAVLMEPPVVPDEIKEEAFAPFENTGHSDGDGHTDGALEGIVDGVIGAPPGNPGSGNGPAPALRVEQVPKLIKKVKPGYPDLAVKTHTQGKVVIDAETDIYGRVIKTKVISGPPLLIAAAIEAVKQWVYEPYIVNGHPRPVRFSVVLEFALQRR